MAFVSQLNWNPDFLDSAPAFEEENDSCFHLLRETDDDQTIAERGLQHDAVASFSNLILASLTPGSTESELIASELQSELQRLPLEQDIRLALDEVPGGPHRPSKRSRVALEFLMDDGQEGPASRFFPLVEHLGPEVTKIFQYLESTLGKSVKFELEETGEEAEEAARSKIREAIQRLGVASHLRTIARQVVKILLTHRLAGEVEVQEEQPPPYQPSYQPFQMSSLPSYPPPPIESPPPCLPPPLTLPPPLDFSDCGRNTDDFFDFETGAGEFERQLSLTGLEHAGSFPFPPLDTDGGVSVQLQHVLNTPVPAYFPNVAPKEEPKKELPMLACPDYGQIFPSAPTMSSVNFFNYLDPNTQRMLLAKMGAFQPGPDLRLDKPNQEAFRAKAECPPYPYPSFSTPSFSTPSFSTPSFSAPSFTARPPSIHEVSNKSLVIPKYVTPMWTPAQNGGPHTYYEVRVCVQTEVGEETNLYNSIDLCVGAGLTAKQARVNLTKWRKKHPDLAGVRGKIDGGVTHQSPFCVTIKAVQSILTEFKRAALLVYFLDDRGQERLNSMSPVCRWPTPFWADQMTQKRNASDLTRSKRKAAANNVEQFSDDEG